MTRETLDRIDGVIEGLRKGQSLDDRQLGLVASAVRSLGNGHDAEVRQVLAREPVILTQFERRLDELDLGRANPGRGRG
jgi:hypothetical protein